MRIFMGLVYAGESSAQLFPTDPPPLVSGLDETCETTEPEYPSFEQGGGYFQFTICCSATTADCRIAGCEDNPEWGESGCQPIEPPPSPTGTGGGAGGGMFSPVIVRGTRIIGGKVTVGEIGDDKDGN